MPLDRCVLRLVFPAGLLILAGCASDLPPPAPDLAVPDLVVFDLAVVPGPDLLGEEPNACGDFASDCRVFSLGPCRGSMFPLSIDETDPNVRSDGVVRDLNGYLAMDQQQPPVYPVWVPNPADWGMGTISKVNPWTLREVARYPAVTCFSTGKGSRATCDGAAGCCAADDPDRYEARKNNRMEPPRLQVPLAGNAPSRTDIDLNGDLFVGNRAPGGFPSVTKIANDASQCRDRNGNKKIDTSADVNGDGLIQTDCNDDGQPDDLDAVRNKPCTNGKPQEFFGLDDECVLFTTGAFRAPKHLGELGAQKENLRRVINPQQEHNKRTSSPIGRRHRAVAKIQTDQKTSE